MKRRILVSAIAAALSLLLNPSAGAVAQDAPEATADEEVVAESDAPAEGERYKKFGSVTFGLMLVDQNGESSKLDEYRDFSPGLFVERLLYKYEDTQAGRYFDFGVHGLGRDDPGLQLEFGSVGSADSNSAFGWSVDASWSRIRHLRSTSAQSPYEYLGNGRYDVARSIIDAIQISNVNDARSWTKPDAGPGQPGEDLRIARVLSESVQPIELGTERDTAKVGFNLRFSERTSARIEFKHEDRDGSVVTGAAIGDRPPRSLVVQLPEPIDQQTYDIKLGVEHVGRNYHVDASYQFSHFDNNIAALTWNSLFHAPGYFTAGATDYDGIRIPGNTKYATSGAIALSPDNTAQQLALNFGANLPLRGSLNVSMAFGRMRQDEDLLPFATSNFGGTQNPTALPRDSAEAKIDTTMFNVVYAVNPIDRLNLKFHYRYYDLDNKTEQVAWFGNTQDSSSRAIFSQRYNIGYDLEQQNLGADLSYYFGKAGTLAFAFDRERKDRPQREVQVTEEDIYHLTYRVRPTHGTAISLKLGKSYRDGTPYNGEIVDQTYAYDPFGARFDLNNPLSGFGDHPGLRRFDVTDRERDEVDLSFAFTPNEHFDARFSYRGRRNDYDSEMVSVINVWNPALQAFVDAPVDPTQLGLLRDKSEQLSLDLNYTVREGLSLNAFASREAIELEQRGRYMNEDNRLNNIGAGTSDWMDTTGAYLWDANIKDHTNTLGLGVNYAPVDGKFDVSVGFSHSKGTVDIDYVAGAKIIENDTTSVNNYAEWTSPPGASFKTDSLTVSWSRELTPRLTLGLRYLYEVYRITDWQQEGTAGHQNAFNPWFVGDNDPETAGTSQDRAGSRLVRLGDLLAPDYDAHVGLVTLEYRW